MRLKPLTVVFVLGIALLFFMFSAYGAYVTTSVYPVFRTFEGQRLAKETESYEMEEQGQIRIWYTTQDQLYIQDMMEMVLDCEKSLEKFFFYPIEYMDVVIYPSEDEMFSELRIPAGDQVMGAYYGGRVNILSPRVWEEKGYLSGNSESQIENTLLHEMTHFVIDFMTKGNFPIWFTEGAALYMEYAVLGYEWPGDVGTDEFYSMGELEKHFSSLNENRAYKQSFLLTKYIVEEYGKENYCAILPLLAKGIPFHRALKEIYGKDIQQLTEGIDNGL